MRTGKIVGFFRETHPFLVGRNRVLPSFDAHTSDSSCEDEELIASYLDQGHEHDYFGSRPILKRSSDRGTLERSGLNLTDGEWIWPSELSYYLREFHLRLPHSFVAHVKANAWRVPDEVPREGLMFPGTAPGDFDAANVPVAAPANPKKKAVV